MLVSLCPSVFFLFLCTAVHDVALSTINTDLSGHWVPSQEKEMGSAVCAGEEERLHRRIVAENGVRHPFQKESFSGSLRPSYTRAEFTASIFPLYRRLFVTRAAPCLYPAAVAAGFQNKSTKVKKRPQKSQYGVYISKHIIMQIWFLHYFSAHWVAAPYPINPHVALDLKKWPNSFALNNFDVSQSV